VKHRDAGVQPSARDRLAGHTGILIDRERWEAMVPAIEARREELRAELS
jgi:hypothetical protein